MLCCMRIAISLLIVFVTFSNSFSQTTYTLADMGLWADPTNWSPNGVPGIADTAEFSDGFVNHDLAWNAVTGNTFTTELRIVGNIFARLQNLESTPITHSTSRLTHDGSSLATLTVDGMQLNVFNASAASATIGHIIVDGAHSAGSLVSIDGDLQIRSFSLQSGGDLTAATMSMLGGAFLSGIENGSTLTTDKVYFNNAQLLEVQAGGVIQTTDAFIGEQSEGIVTITGNGAALSADQLIVGLTSVGTLNIDNLGSVVVANQTTIGSNGTVAVANGGILDVGTMAIEDAIRISGISGSLSGDLLNNNFLNVASIFSNDFELDTTNLNFVNSAVMHGTETLMGHLQNEIGGEVRLFNGDWMRFLTSGHNDGELNNIDGVIEFDGLFDNSVTGFVTGHGLFIFQSGATNDGVYAFSGDADVFGDILNAGSGQIVTSAGATTVFYDDVDHNGMEIRTSLNSNMAIFGAASGSGSYTGTGTVFFEGDLRPGNSPGQVVFEGSVSLGNTATAEIEIAGTGAGQFDQLIIAGDCSIGGSLAVVPIDGYVLQAGDEFTIAEIGGLAAGQFAGLADGDLVGNFGGIDLYITYAGGDGNDVVLTTDDPNVLLGDVNMDGAVNLLDVDPFIALLSSGQYQAEADINQDGVVNLLDVAPFIGVLAGN